MPLENTNSFQLGGKSKPLGSDKTSRFEFESRANASILFFTTRPIKHYFPICQPHLVASGLKLKVEQASGEIWTLVSPPFQAGVPLCGRVSLRAGGS